MVIKEEKLLSVVFIFIFNIQMTIFYTEMENMLQFAENNL